MACDQYYSYVKALLHFNGTDGQTTTTDATGLRTWTRSGQAQIDTAQSVFGGSASLFDGNGDYWYTADSNDSNIGTGDFCIECRIRIAGASANADNVSGNRHMAIIGTNAGSTGWQIYVLGNTTNSNIGISMEVKLSGVSGYVNLWHALALNQWYGLAITRHNGWVRVFIDGAKLHEMYLPNDIQGGTNGMWIGRSPTTNYYRSFNGWIEELRFTNGKSRYVDDYILATSQFETGGCGAAPRTFACDQRAIGAASDFLGATIVPVVTEAFSTGAAFAWDMRSYLDGGLAVAWDMVSWFENSQQLQWGRSADFTVRRCLSWGVLMPVTTIARPMAITPSASGSTLNPVHNPAALNGGLSSCED